MGVGVKGMLELYQSKYRPDLESQLLCVGFQASCLNAVLIPPPPPPRPSTFLLNDVTWSLLSFFIIILLVFVHHV